MATITAFAQVATIASPVITAMLIFNLQRVQRKRDDESRERARARQEESYHTMQMTKATMALCQANAVAIQTGRVNGEMEAAMKYCADADREFTQFVRRQGAANIHRK